MCIIDNHLFQLLKMLECPKKWIPAQQQGLSTWEALTEADPALSWGRRLQAATSSWVSSQRTASTHTVTSQVIWEVQWSGSLRAVISITRNEQGKKKALSSTLSWNIPCLRWHRSPPSKWCSSVLAKRVPARVRLWGACVAASSCRQAHLVTLY